MHTPLTWIFASLCFFAGLGRLPTVTGNAEPFGGSMLREERNIQEGLFPPTNTRIDVLVVLQGPSDHVTAPTFRDIAETVQDGLHGLGHPSRIVYCTNIALDGCLAGGGKVIVLGAHNLASFYTGEGKSAVLELKLLPPDAVLYNFELVPRVLKPSAVQPGGRDGDRSLVTSRTLQIYASYRLWDYSEGNVERLRDVGIRADLVPLGFSAKLGSSSGHARDHEGEDIDVLFIGMETPTRKTVIHRLRDAGISVVHPNSDGIHLYGAAFDAMSARSKIVLNLNAFRDAADDCSDGSSISISDGSDSWCTTGEWKMPRLARLLANGRFVVSEMGGTARERAKVSGGIVFVDPGGEGLVETCRYYLERPELRTAIASRGRRLFERQLESEILSMPVQAMLGERRTVS